MARGLVEAFAESDQSGGGGPDLAGLFTWSGGPAVPATGTLSPGIAGSIGVNAAVDPSQGGSLDRNARRRHQRRQLWLQHQRRGGLFGPAVGLADGSMHRGPSTPAAGLDLGLSLTDFATASVGWLEGERKTASDAADYQSALLSRASTPCPMPPASTSTTNTRSQLQLEQSYQASSKLIGVIDQMFHALLDAVGLAMRTTFISTASLLNTPRAGIRGMQSELVRLNKEVVTGRMADVGLNLGAGAGRQRDAACRPLRRWTRSRPAISWSRRSLQQTQTALDNMRTGADRFLKHARSRRATGATRRDAGGAGRRSPAFIGNANASDGRTYLFGGINTANPPIADYDAGPQAAIDAAFLAKFGITPGRPGRREHRRRRHDRFPRQRIRGLFADPAWGTTWSSASDQAMTSRISPTEKMTTSVSANEPAMRKLAMVYSMIAELGTGGSARRAQRDHRQGDEHCSAGRRRRHRASGQRRRDAEPRQQTPTTGSSQQKDMLAAPHRRRWRASTRPRPRCKIDTLSTQIEMSYSLTAKLLQMSILNYV